MSELTNITSANASLVLIVDTIIPAGVQLQHFSTDSMFELSEVTVTEDRMGVDGNLAAGWIPSIKTVKVDLEAGSPSMWFMDMLASAMESDRTIYKCTLIATIPSIRKIYTWTGGVLKTGTMVNNAKKVLDPTSWTFDFADLAILPY